MTLDHTRPSISYMMSTRDDIAVTFLTTVTSIDSLDLLEHVIVDRGGGGVNSYYVVERSMTAVIKNYRKTPKNSSTQKFVVITLQFKQDGFTVE